MVWATGRREIDPSPTLQMRRRQPARMTQFEDLFRVEHARRGDFRWKDRKPPLGGALGG